MFSPEKIRSQTPASIKHAAEMYAKGASSRELAEQPGAQFRTGKRN